MTLDTCSCKNKKVFEKFRFLVVHRARYFWPGRLWSLRNFQKAPNPQLPHVRRFIVALQCSKVTVYAYLSFRKCLLVFRNCVQHHVHIILGCSRRVMHYNCTIPDNRLTVSSSRDFEKKPKKYTKFWKNFKISFS